MTLTVSGTTVVNTNRSFVLGTATPGTAYTGMIRYNSSLQQFEVYNGSSWSNIVTTLSQTPPLYTWGTNNFGQLGDGTTTNRSSPVSVIGGITDWVQISAKGSNTAALRANGEIWTWGRNNFGQLGDTTITNRSSPVSLVGGITDWKQVSVGNFHMSGLRGNGTIWSWGVGSSGRLGNLSTASVLSPVSVVGGYTDWIQLSIGGANTTAIRSNGTAWSWGANSFGQLGDGSATDRSSPVSVVGGFTDWVQVSAGYIHVLATRSNGTAWGWGRNNFGQLGDNTVTTRSSPVSVVGGFTNWTRISAGNIHSTGVRANGEVWSWGSAGQGELGNGSITNRSSPVAISGGGAWIETLAGSSFSIGLRTSGTMSSWGGNGGGQLGLGNTINRSSPVDVLGGSGYLAWTQIAVSAYGTHVAALRSI